MMRPADIHMAIRADLVSILKDVVDLIARIEAGIPNPPEESHERTSRTTGECPEASPADETHPVTGAGAAGPQGTVATITDQPTDAPPPGVEPAAPPAAPSASQPQPAPQETPRTKTDQALDLWATTDLTEAEITERIGCSPGSVRSFVYAARNKNDPRGFARKMPMDEEPSPPPAPIAERPWPSEPARVIRKSEEKEPPVSGFAKPVESKPFSKPLDPRPGRIAGVVITSPGAIISIDMESFIVACPGGDWQVTRPVARVMEKLRNGDLFDDKTLADVGPMPVESFKAQISEWKRALEIRGVEFLSMKGAGCKIRVAGT